MIPKGQSAINTGWLAVLAVRCRQSVGTECFQTATFEFDTGSPTIGRALCEIGAADFEEIH